MVMSKEDESFLVKVFTDDEPELAIKQGDMFVFSCGTEISVDFVYEYKKGATTHE